MSPYPKSKLYKSKKNKTKEGKKMKGKGYYGRSQEHGLNARGISTKEKNNNKLIQKTNEEKVLETLSKIKNRLNKGFNENELKSLLNSKNIHTIRHAEDLIDNEISLEEKKDIIESNFNDAENSKWSLPTIDHLAAAIYLMKNNMILLDEPNQKIKGYKYKQPGDIDWREYTIYKKIDIDFNTDY